MTLAESMIATAVGSIIATGLASLTFFTARSFSAMANYVDLDHRSRMALDTMSKEIRQANRVTQASATSLTLDYDGGPIQYSYNAEAKTLTRTKNGVPDSQPLLEECDSLTFSTYQRNPIDGTYDQYPTTAAANTCKLVQLRWICSRKILGVTKNTESVQSAKVVIRKQ